jgi:hypothetical protein
MHAFKSLFRKASPPLIDESKVHEEAEREGLYHGDRLRPDHSPGIGGLFRSWSMTKVNKEEHKSKLNQGYSEENISKFGVSRSYNEDRNSASSRYKEEKTSLIATETTETNTSESRKSRSAESTSNGVKKTNVPVAESRTGKVTMETARPLRGELHSKPVVDKVFSGATNGPIFANETHEEDRRIRSYSDYDSDENIDAIPFEFAPVKCSCIVEQGVRISNPNCVDHGTNCAGCLCDEHPVTYKITPSPECELHAKWYRRHGTRMPDPNACRCIKYGSMVVRHNGCLQHGEPPKCCCTVGWGGEKIKSPVCDVHSRFNSLNW